MVEINTPPSRSVEDITREYLAGAGLAVEAARTLDLRLYPLAAYPLAAECALRDVRKNPTGFVAQECMDFSTHVLGDGGPPGESFVDLRAFVLPAVGYVMPGGLTRVAKPGTRIVNSSSGGSFKDTWVLEA